MNTNLLKVGAAVAISSFVTPRLVNMIYSPIDMGDTGDNKGANMQLVVSVVANAVISAGIYYALARVG